MECLFPHLLPDIKPIDYIKYAVCNMAAAFTSHTCTSPACVLSVLNLRYLLVYSAVFRMSWCSAWCKNAGMQVFCVSEADFFYMKNLYEATILILCLHPVVMKGIREAFDAQLLDYF